MNPAMAQDIQQINRVFEQEAAAKHTVDAWDRVYQECAILPPGAETVAGRENFNKFRRTAMETMGVQAAKLQTVEFEPPGDTDFEFGRELPPDHGLSM
jgi:hypothetical protein